jgi:hypothetical protein
MGIEITPQMLARMASKIVEILKFKNSANLRLAAVVTINWQLGLDVCPASSADGADPTLRPHILAAAAGAVTLHSDIYYTLYLALALLLYDKELTVSIRLCFI